MSNWKKNKDEADKYSEQAIEIIKECTKKLIDIEEASLFKDQNEATDFTIDSDINGGVGWRVRQPGKDFNREEWTIRSKLDSGAETELSKLKKGCGRWYLFGWIKNNKIDSWVFIDLDIVREKGILDMEWLEKANINDYGEYDGTYFISVPIVFLLDKECIILSYNIKKNTEIKIKERCNMTGISKAEQEWIKYEGTHNVGITSKMIEAWYIEYTAELKEIGLDKSLGGDEAPAFIEMVKTGVIGRIQANITVEPTDFDLMTLGPYPEKLINKKRSVEIVGFGSMDGGNPEITTISARNDFVRIENDIKPLESYRTGFSFFPNDRISNPKRFKLTVQGATEFSEATKINFMGETYEEKVELLRQIIPKVDLVNIEKNQSRLIKSKKKHNICDSLDLKRVTVMVVGTADSIDKNGRAWAMFKVVDSTFRPTIKIKNIAVWVNPSIFNRLQAGEDSILEIYGTIEKNYDGSIGMNACFIHPILIKSIDENGHSFYNKSEKEDQNKAHTPEIVWPGNKN